MAAMMRKQIDLAGLQMHGVHRNKAWTEKTESLEPT